MMDVPRVLLILLLLAFLCSIVAAFKHDPGESSLKNGPPSIRRNRRIALNEYLVPPPPPRNYPSRSGRVVNNQPSEAPGYFSKFMDWINPFGFGSQSSAPLNLPPYVETSLPPAPQSHNPPFNLHPTPQSGPPLHLPSASQDIPSLYPPPGPHPNQHSGLILTPPLNVHPGPVYNPPPSPSLPTIYNAPPPTLHGAQYVPSTPTNGHGPHLPGNKGKPCNPCNRMPWIPMQGDGFQSDKYHYPSPQSNGYLPPSNQVSHDAQLAASHEIKTSDFPHVLVEQNGQPLISPPPNPLLYPGPMPPLFNAKPFDRPYQSPHLENVGHFESQPLPIASPTAQGQKTPDIGNEHLNIHDNYDLTSSGTQVNQGHVSVLSQNHGIEISKEPVDTYKESFGTSIIDNQPPISAPSSDQEYRNPSASKQEDSGISNRPIEVNQDTVTNFGSPTLEGHSFNNQNDDAYRESYESNSGQNSGSNYWPPNLNPSASFGASTFSNENQGNLNYQYSDDLSPSGSVAKNSHVTTQTPFINGHSAKKDVVHFEESPLLDLTKKSESRTDAQWPLPTSTYIDADESSNTPKTTVNYLETDNTYFEDASDLIGPTEPYSSSNIHSVENTLGPSTPVAENLSVNGKKQQDTPLINTQYANQQDVSYIPPSRQSGYLWPSLLLNSKNDSAKNEAFLDPLARWNNFSKEIANSEKQDGVDSKDTNDALVRQSHVKRNKQVQVIIPYTSEYTPIPFQQSYGDWSVRNDFGKTQPRKVPHSSESNIDNYVQQESRNEIRLINQLQSQFTSNNSNKLNPQSTKPQSTVPENDVKGTTIKANNSIDIRRLQKNIDNWTIQEYSKPTTSSTIVPSSLHPYLLPSKRIPTEYLTTTETGDRSNESSGTNENVKSYSLAGFSFNEVEHEGSASNQVEQIQTPAKVVRANSSKLTSTAPSGANKSTTKGSSQSTWQGDSVSISPTNKERVYVVTPQPIPGTSPTSNFEKQKGQSAKDNFQRAKQPVSDGERDKDDLSEFEAIEKAYQVLPQAVNNLAVASTGKEDIPLWGIMEHDVFASLNLDEIDKETAKDVVDRPVLYSGHSKVSRAKR